MTYPDDRYTKRYEKRCKHESFMHMNHRDYGDIVVSFNTLQKAKDFCGNYLNCKAIQNDRCQHENFRICLDDFDFEVSNLGDYSTCIYEKSLE